MSAQVSKEVQKVRDYEAALLKQYQAYLKLLLAASQQQGKQRPGHDHAHSKALAHARVAVKCQASLLTAKPEFNYA